MEDICVQIIFSVYFRFREEGRLHTTWWGRRSVGGSRLRMNWWTDQTGKTSGLKHSIDSSILPRQEKRRSWMPRRCCCHCQAQAGCWGFVFSVSKGLLPTMHKLRSCGVSRLRRVLILQPHGSADLDVLQPRRVNSLPCGACHETKWPFHTKKKTRRHEKEGSEPAFFRLGSLEWSITKPFSFFQDRILLY